MANIFIDGGTGSLGNQLTSMLLTQPDVERIVIYSRDELKQSKMRKRFPDARMRFILGDVRNEAKTTRAMAGCTHVIHCAAMKQVDTCEYNSDECVATNVGGAQSVINACLANGVRQCIALSTDKACSPINIYGATKLTSDKLFISANNLVGKEHTRFAVVRYGNVVGSRGSVFPFFKSLPKGTPTPVTHAEMTRFLIRIEDAAQMVLDGFKRMHGGEIFVPKLKSALMLDVARALRPDEDVEIMGVRPGEKMHEAMTNVDDSVVEHEWGYVIVPSIRFHDMDISYGKAKRGLEYNSRDNEFYSIDELRSMA
jgi:UDP-N-acetylglucosamine 4,6-dehydratase